MIRCIAIAALTVTACAGPAPTPSDPFAGAASTADLLACDGPISDLGGRSESGFGDSAGAASADEAFRAWLPTSAFAIPRSGYRKLGSDANRHVYVFEAAGRAKVVVLFEPVLDEVNGGMPFILTELRACAPSEWGADADLGQGVVIWEHEETGRVLFDRAGSEHCDWESVRILHVDRPDGTLGAQYVRDPQRVLRGAGLLDSYADDVELPDGAEFSGYRSTDGMELWFTPENRAAFVVTPDGVERWPRVRDGIGCA
ncbi:MAG: hypothetical protein K5924_00735 [Chloroflexi bacterium]|nr:hypothetical protein [Chloroflexota bacterium]